MKAKPGHEEANALDVSTEAEDLIRKWTDAELEIRRITTEQIEPLEYEAKRARERLAEIMGDNFHALEVKDTARVSYTETVYGTVAKKEDGTPYTMEEVREDLLSMGADDVVQERIMTSALNKLVRSLLKDGREFPRSVTYGTNRTLRLYPKKAAKEGV